MLNEPYCPAPWIALNPIASTGDLLYVPCCSWEGTRWQGKVSELDSNYLQDIKKSMLEHNMDKLKTSCRQCILKEKLGLLSDRQDFHRKIKEKIFVKEELGWLNLILSNKCNLKCVSCNWTVSSLIAKEENRNVIIPKINDIYNLNLSNLKLLKLVGGEPTIQKECHDFIDYVCENYNTSKLSFSYTTNTTVVNKKWLDKLKKFNYVSCEMSIDGTGKIFEYLRSNAKWNIVEKNINKMKKFSENEYKIELKFHVVIGIVLLVTIKEWLPWFINHEIETEFHPLNGTNGPIEALHPKYKQPIIEYLNNINHSYAKKLLPLLTVEYDQTIFNKFKSHILNKDRLRNTDIKTVHPILQSMFN